MKKRELIVGAIALAGTVSGMVSMQAAYATLTCTAGTASTPLACTGSADATSFLAETMYFTGSNGVTMDTSDTTAGVALCGSHISGRHSYGLTTDGGSMVTRTGTGKAVNVDSGCVQ